MTLPPEPSDPASQEQLVWCRVTGESADDLRSFIEASAADPGCRPVARRTEEGLEALVAVSRAQLEATRAQRSASGIRIEELEDLTAVGNVRRSEVGASDRYATRGSVPHGLGRKE